jgi:hypothetical protein
MIGAQHKIDLPLAKKKDFLWSSLILNQWLFFKVFFIKKYIKIIFKIYFWYQLIKTIKNIKNYFF